MSAGLLTLLVAPTVWSGYSVIYDTESSFPTAGPNAQSDFGDFANARGSFPGGNGNGENQARGQSDPGSLAGGFGGFAGVFGGGSAQTDPALISYLEAHQGNAKFLVATPNANMADSIILSTNKPVMAMGGFSGNDPILTTSNLQTLIKDGVVRFFLINSQRGAQRLIGQIPEQYRNFFSGRGGGGFNFGGSGRNSLSTWVSSHCNTVPTKDWQSLTGNSAAGFGGSQLYDCASARS